MSAFLDSNVVLYALGNDEPNGFSHFDSLILASVLACGCSTLYSEDLQDGQVIEDRLTVRNPFVEVGTL